MAVTSIFLSHYPIRDMNPSIGAISKRKYLLLYWNYGVDMMYRNRDEHCFCERTKFFINDGFFQIINERWTKDLDLSLKVQKLYVLKNRGF